MSSITPMMQQYLDIKEKYSDCILFFRLGDFYEMFFEDAETASRELEITLTGRNCGLDERAPMCGVPFHSAESYISRLIKKGYKVAICEQVEDPSKAKGLVDRQVVKVITPGTVIDSSTLDEKKNNYLMCIYKKGYYFGLSVTDISTGELYSTQISWGNTFNKLMDEIAKYSPAEIIANPELVGDKKLLAQIRTRCGAFISPCGDHYFTRENVRDRLADRFKNNEILSESFSFAAFSAAALLQYLEETQKAALKHIQTLNLYRIDEYMVLDSFTRRNLELTETMREKSRKGTLLWVLDRTMTSMGGRTLRKWIEQPLIRIDDINDRLDAVAELTDKFMVRSEIREILKKVYDIERLMSRIILGNVNGRDLISLKSSLGRVPGIRTLLEDCSSSLIKRKLEQLDPLEDIYELIDKSIEEEPPVTIREGNIIKKGYNEEVDRLREASTKGKVWIAELENRERARTGIKNLRISYNKVFGYYIEVTKSNLSLVPEDYIRKQTLVGCERYITDELKKIEDTILGAEEKVVQLEYDLFMEIKGRIVNEVERIKNTASALSEIDALCSLAEVADRENYCKPDVNTNDVINIKDGRHPVVEKMLGQGEFVPNDVYLDLDENRISIITGPNMAGKSTYMRQTALIVLMAQIGSFVPASFAQIGITDRIFTRVGASDDLAAGQSTFMIEMSEVANILRNASERSLIILDEIGRGTSTFDGLSIAWAVIEYISSGQLGSRTMFATHYHELTELEGKIKGIKNYCIAVEEKGEDIIFLRKIKRGGADGSYGIQVARLAGVPQPVIDRAKEILAELEDADISKKETRTRRGRKPIEGQIDIFETLGASRVDSEIINELKSIDISSITPIDAMNILYRLQKKAGKE